MHKDYPGIQPGRDHKITEGKDGLHVYNTSLTRERGTALRPSSPVEEIISTQEIC